MRTGSVIILSAEDDAEDTIRPRLEAAGADLKRVFILDAIREPNRDGALTTRPFNLTADIERLSDLARKLGDVGLIDIDPITAYLGGVDSHKNAEVRGVLAPLAAMAAETEAAIVCVSHLNKAGGPRPCFGSWARSGSWPPLGPPTWSPRIRTTRPGDSSCP